MKMFWLAFLAFLMASPVIAGEAERKGQCEAWAQEDGLQGKDAAEFIEYCMEEASADAMPQDSVSGAN